MEEKDIRELLESLSREDLEFVSECCGVCMYDDEPLADHIDDIVKLAEDGRVSKDEIINAANEGA